MLWIIWYVFTTSVVLLALTFIPVILYWQSQCVNIRLVDKQGAPIAGAEIYGVYDETAYATSVAGGYGTDTVYTRTPVATGTYTKRLGKTDENGEFKTRIWLGSYWGLKLRKNDESVSVLLERFATQRNFSQKPKLMVFDTSRTIFDPRWFSGE